MTLRALAFASLLVACAPRLVGAAGPETLVPAKDPGDALMKGLLDALKSNSYALFGTVFSPETKLSQPAFERLSRQWAPQLLKGYKTTFLTTLRKPTEELELWKLEPAGSAEDYALIVTFKGGRIAAFSFR
jgi:hypothetical protein